MSRFLAVKDARWFRALLFALGIVASACHDDTSSRPRAPPPDGGLICTACSGECAETLAIASSRHVEGAVSYSDEPPAGGDHSACWATWGVHSVAVAPEHWVHNLEHGGIVLLYVCPAGCAADVARLEDFVGTHPRTLLTPYPKLPERFAAVAWGRRLVSGCLDLGAVGSFYDAFFDAAPESYRDDPPAGCP